jgi:dTDP-4-dehydrorhamnose 3,5-epimerase
MKFISLPLMDAYTIELEPTIDERGFFARTWCAQEFKLRGLNPNLAQCSVSFSRQKGTLRGLHYQNQPYPEAKLVRCCAGSIYDVILDLRPPSPSYRKWFAVELTAANRKMVYVPQGFAHGFQSLADETEVFYQISESHRPELARGVRWDDPQFAITWPIREPIISERDRTFVDYKL